MYVVVVYDTAAERNPKILRTCRKFLHHVQRSVFEGQLSEGQLRHFQAAVENALDLSYDNVLVYIPTRHYTPPPRMGSNRTTTDRHPLTQRQPNPGQPGLRHELQRHTGPKRTTGGLLQIPPPSTPETAA